MIFNNVNFLQCFPNAFFFSYCSLDLGIFTYLTLLSGFPGGWDGKEYLPMQETSVWSLGWGGSFGEGNGYPLAWGILAWRISWTEEPVELQSTGLTRVRHNWKLTFSFFSPFFQMHPRLMSSFTEIESESSSSVMGQLTWVGLCPEEWLWFSFTQRYPEIVNLHTGTHTHTYTQIEIGRKRTNSRVDKTEGRTVIKG